ncbi:MAG: hypothetical protein IPP94_14930 [Ignavibacteria bacterium]|nr:hypothetical protein [Ignavibacteria bacterium]
MKHNVRPLFAAFAVAAQMICMVPASAQITLTLQQPPPYQFKLEHMWKVTLMNPTKTTFTVYMIGRATERKDGRIVEATTAQFPLPPGLKIVGSRELQPLDVKESNTRYSDVVKQIGSVPTGDYDICVTVYDASNNAVLGEMCVQSLVENLTQIELLAPLNGVAFSSGRTDDEAEMGVYHDLPRSLRILLASIPRDLDPRTAIWAIMQTRAAGFVHQYPPATNAVAPPEQAFGDPWVVRNWPEWEEYLDERRAIEAGGHSHGYSAQRTPQDSARSHVMLEHFQKEILALDNPAALLQALKDAEHPQIIMDVLARRVYNRMHGNGADGVPDNLTAGPTIVCFYCPACKEIHCYVKEPPKKDPFDDSWNSRRATGTQPENTSPLPGGIMTFSWLPPAPIPPQSRFTYSLKITEIIGRQSPYDAFHSNPAAIVLANIATNMVQLPLAARRLGDGHSGSGERYRGTSGTTKSTATRGEFMGTWSDRYANTTYRPGARYAWGIDVYLNNVLVQSSEVWSFVLENEGAFGARPPRDVMIETEQDVRDRRRAPGSTGVLRSHETLYASLLTDPEFLRGPFSADPLQFPLPEPIVFSGTARIDARHASRVGSYSEMPRNSLTADIRPGMVLYGLPFESYFQYSTLQDSSRQSMNSFGVNFNFDGFRQGLESRYQDLASASPNFSSLGYEQYSDMADPRKLAGNLDQYGAISGAEKLFMSIRSLGIGTNYPSYSEYVLSGVPVTGVNVELNPGMFYTAFTASRNQRPIDNAAYLRDLYAGRLGVGAKEGDHLYVSGLYAADDGASIRLDPANLTLTPRENYVLGMEGRLKLFGDALAFEAEGAASLFTRDTRDPEFASSSIPTFVRNMTNPRLSSSVDYMYSGRLVYSNMGSATKISAGVKMIGPGYASLGVPQLRTDQFGYEAKLDQQLFDRRVTFGSFFRMYNDNLIDWKSSTTTMTAYGINLGLNIPRLPYLRVSFSPIMQKNDASDPLYKFQNTMLMVTAMTGYSYSIASLGASTSFSYAGQRTETGSTLTDYQTNSFMLTQMQSFAFPLTIGLNLGFIESRNTLGYGMIQTVDVSGSSPLGEMVTVGLGVTLAFDRSRNERLGVYADGGLRVIDGIDLSVRLEKTNYNDFFLSTDTYREFLASLGIMARW